MPSPALGFETSALRPFAGCISPEPASYARLETINDFDTECMSLIRQNVLIKNSFSLTRTQKNNIEALLERSWFFYAQYKRIREDPSSGLMAYYFALNLAKAYLWLWSDYTGIKMLHGLEFSFQTIDSVRVHSSSTSGKVNVFPELYAQLRSNTLANGDELKVDQLLGHIKELGLQAYFAGFKFSNLSVKSVIPTIADQDKAWSVIRMDNLDTNLLHGNKTLLRCFNRFFTQVELSSAERDQLFRETAFQSSKYVYFQSKPEYSFSDINLLNIAENDIRKSFQERVEVNVFDLNTHYDIHLPIRGRRNYFIDELAACYVLLFWTSSAIRYDPTLKVVGSKTSKRRFLFDEINKTAPYIVLRKFTSLFVQRDLSFEIRS